MADTVLEFGAQPSDSLPATIASFAHPVHVDTILAEMDQDAIFDTEFEGQATSAVVPVAEV